MSTTMPLDSRGIHALQLLTALERLEALKLTRPLQILYLPGEEEPYQIGFHKGQTLVTALEKALRELSEDR